VSAKYLYNQGFSQVSIVEPDDNVKAILPNSFDRYDHVNDVYKKLFSFVILSHVLEHIYDFDAFFSKISSISKVGSILFVEVPNCENNYLLNNSGTSFHYWFFTKKTLIKVLKKHGYSLLDMKFFGKDKFINTYAL